MSLSKFSFSLVRQRNFFTPVSVYLTQKKLYSSSTQINPNRPDWKKAVSEAGKIVGCHTGFLSLRCLLNDEIANVALQLEKKVGDNHSLLKTANLFYNGKNKVQAWGLIVLLVSKAAGHSLDLHDVEEDSAAGVLQSQRALAEITEMIRTSHLVHQGLDNMQPPVNMDTLGKMILGNKIALLLGDYLLSNSCIELTNLKNHELSELIYSAARDLVESEFIEPRDFQNAPLPARPNPEAKEYTRLEENNTKPLFVKDFLGNARAEWTMRHILNAGNLLGKSCQGTFKLAGHSYEMQQKGYLFGKHLALAWQACLDREPFLAGSTGKFNLISAPVLFALQHNPHLYSLIETGLDNIDNVDYKAVRKAVLDGPAMQMTSHLQKDHSEAALEVLGELNDSDARTALRNIIVAMQAD